MSSAAGVRYSNRSVSRSAFQKCMGRVPSDGKIPDDMSAEDKCTVLYSCTGTRTAGLHTLYYKSTLYTEGEAVRLLDHPN